MKDPILLVLVRVAVCLLSLIGSGQIFAQTWNPANISGDLTSVVISSEGSEIAAAAFPGEIYTSTDGGTTWQDETNSPDQIDSPVLASSSNGDNLVAAFY